MHIFAVGFPASVGTEMAFGQVIDGGRMSKWYNGKRLSQMTTEIRIHS